MKEESIDSLDLIEYPKKLKGNEKFYHQNISACIEIADIYIYNPEVENHKYYFLTEQILKYVVEINDKEFSDIMQLINNGVDYHKLGGRLYPYCFKDIYNKLKAKDNQVYTRTLHAEENAFLQISKYGGIGVRGGFLFTTASTCELCAKKAYQLGINTIYYVDPYPGISKNHILKFGTEDNPEMKLFYGAIGHAYISLYTQRISYKDELELVTGKKHENIFKDDVFIKGKRYKIKDVDKFRVIKERFDRRHVF